MAVGGDLTVERLVCAYRNGIFPWFNPNEPILWWSPDPRGVIEPKQISPSRSTRKTCKRNAYQFTLNYNFSDVIKACANARSAQEGTWISQTMMQAYIRLHQAGYAHSIEVWQDKKLVGGLYGVQIGQVFCGESMFHYADNASKAAFHQLGQHCLAANIQLIDCQMQNDHLASLGVYELPRKTFLQQLKQLRDVQVSSSWWLPQKLNYE
ncbi:leucyl/phenylalanyl-tRNA--protein transferase [Gayadomonas joobiniege]|uniref:leucyl/phenylalanyl-tRNA--protein transferase n=1 Tax=Gayadomonas joobiniege TaxID=1234606 RepID=UPI00036EDB75|nr:leucyl/phenylalanyl-tRNA--protein transferase [Gayadomonas joobiniege]